MKILNQFVSTRTYGVLCTRTRNVRIFDSLGSGNRAEQEKKNP